MTLVEFSAEPGQLTHNFNEIALRLRILVLDLISVLIFLLELLL